ncbi:unnamed protein product [Paramecium pentaurelia]|uniref:Uncharacterized protein n=1 Tax=Paramecium pentaurelia TaxID=43138 RepID=A0A8S1XB72_9CILI|nr:unnamed protein product [Paramecium pentaurelia]
MIQNQSELEGNNSMQVQKKISVKLQIRLDNINNEEQNDNQIIQNVFVYYQDQKEMSIDFNHSKMEIDNNQIWFANIEIDPNNVYKYFYKVQQKNKIKQESQTRYFKYDQNGRIAIDEWNSVWCLYRYQQEDPKILEYFQIKIKDYHKKSYQSIDHQNVNESGITYLECSETLKFQEQQKRQFAFIYKNNQDQVELSNQFDPRKGNSFMNNYVLNKFKESIILSNEQEQRINTLVSQKQNISNKNEEQYKKIIQNLENKFNMKQIEVNDYRLQLQKEIERIKESKNKIDQLEQRLKSLESENNHLIFTIQENERVFNIKQKQQEYQREDQILKYIENKKIEFQNKMEQVQKRNNEMLKKQQEKMEEDQKSLQKKSQEVINKYIQMLEEANQKIRNQELKSIQFESDDIKIQIDQSEIPEDYKQNIKDLEQTILQYKNTEQSLKKEKEEVEKYYNDKHEKQKSQYQLKTQDLFNKGVQCQQELNKCKQLLEQKIKESEAKAQEHDQKVERYQILLKALKEKFKKKSDDLEILLQAFKELKEKLEKEQEKNYQLQQELEHTIKSSEQKRQEEFNNFRQVHDQEIKQLQQQNQQELLLEKEKHEKLQIEQQYQQKQLLNELMESTYQKISDVILDPYFDIQKKFHNNLILNFKSEIKTVIKENIDNFETPINQLSLKLSHIQEETLEELKLKALEKHDELVSTIQKFKDDSKIENAQILKESFSKYTAVCNQIQDMAMKINFNNDSDGEYIFQLTQLKSVLDQKLDSVFRLISFSNELQGWNQQFENSRDTITKAYFDLQIRHKSSIK